ncbi:DUF5677 domain-containing protein [Lentzea sp.]|uniref:DUF5677 domain-containing protein n=1 Tax=Lentzea sp. TaxID=56099 RepID=UPI002ED658DE
MSDAAEDAIKVLVKAFDDIIETGQVVIPAENEQVFRAVYGWWTWINRSCKLVLLAHGAGLGHESAPSLRSIVEHSLLLQWVVDVGADAMAAVDAYDEERRRKLYDDLVAAGWPIPEELTRPEGAKHPLRPFLANFAQLCIAYGARSLYIPYRLMSTHVHPTAKGAEAYIREEDGGLADHPVISIFGSFLAAAAVCVVQVALTINDLLDNETLSASINEAQELLGVTIERPKLS